MPISSPCTPELYKSSGSTQAVLPALPGGEKGTVKLCYGLDPSHPLASSNLAQYKGQGKTDTTSVYYVYLANQHQCSDRGPRGMKRHWSRGVCAWQDTNPLTQLWHTVGAARVQSHLSNSSPFWETSTEDSGAVTLPCVCWGHPPTRRMSLNRPAWRLKSEWQAEIQIEKN